MRTTHRQRFVCSHASFIVSLLVLLAAPTSTPPATAAQNHSPFFIASSGCAMAHCDIGSTDFNLLGPPTQTPVQLFRDPAPGGSLGLGCVSNGTIVACTYSPDPGNQELQECLEDCLVVYDATGYILYKSGSLFSAKAQASVPVMDQSGNLIMADNRTIARINPYVNADGEYEYMQRHEYGLPYSPTISNAGLVVFIATSQFQDGAVTQGPGIAAWFADDLTPIGSMQITGTQRQVYETRNTPGVSGNRVYVVMNAVDNDSDGMLAAIDIDPFHSSPFSQAWTYEFIGRSGASPTVAAGAQGVRIYFDGMDRNTAYPHAMSIGLTDHGTFATEAWPPRDLGPGRILASATLDPRGTCIWTFVTPQSKIYCLDPDTGLPHPDHSIDLTMLPISNSSQMPSSALTISNAGSASDPIMLLGTIDNTFNPTRRGPLSQFASAAAACFGPNRWGWAKALSHNSPSFSGPGCAPESSFQRTSTGSVYLGRNP